jgi:hypothetical protein
LKDSARATIGSEAAGSVGLLSGGGAGDCAAGAGAAKLQRLMAIDVGFNPSTS